MSISGFPRELLDRPPGERVAYFKNYALAHPLLRTAYDALIRAIREPAGASIISVCGPTGVGKTTLLRRVQIELIEQSLPDLKKDPGRIPVVCVEAIAPDSGNFNWKDYYIRALEAFNEPLINNKSDVALPGKEPHIVGRKRVTTEELRRALERALRHRRPDAFIIDEAQHLAKMASGRRLQDQLDSVKSLANLTGTLHVLVGTYELLVFRELSGQLSRRKVDIHLPRYRAEHQEDLQAFVNVLHTFEHHLPLKEKPNLVQSWDYCYERSIGCVGVLKDWLTRSLASALEEGASTLSLTHLKQCALSVAQCEKMATEALEGEAKLKEDEGANGQLLRILGMKMEDAPVGKEKAAASKRKFNRVGERNPERDPVGVTNNVG
jgi:nucleoside-triphosphatase THEP1